MSQFHQIPDPKPEVSGANNRAVLTRLRQIISLWRPIGAREPGISTIARFAHRLMGSDGNAYTADEIIAQGGGTVDNAAVVAAIGENETAILTALGIPTYANLAAANAALSLGQIYFDTALGTLNTATA